MDSRWPKQGSDFNLKLSDMDMGVMRWIPPGRCVIGSLPIEEGRESNDKDPQWIEFVEGFWMGITLVTQSQFYHLIQPDCESHFTGDDLPVEEVDWDESMLFCAYMTSLLSRNGYIPNGWQFTLPTEFQWEYACRAGSSAAYSGSGNLENMGWFQENSGGETHPVGEKLPNAWGLYDMHGNVWEWCRDWYTGKLRGLWEKNDDGTYDDAQPRYYRSLRGGSWRDGKYCCRASSRNYWAPAACCKAIGFRMVLNTSVR